MSLHFLLPFSLSSILPLLSFYRSTPAFFWLTRLDSSFLLFYSNPSDLRNYSLLHSLEPLHLLLTQTFQLFHGDFFLKIAPEDHKTHLIFFQPYHASAATSTGPIQGITTRWLLQLCTGLWDLPTTENHQHQKRPIFLVWFMLTWFRGAKPLFCILFLPSSSLTIILNLVSRINQVQIYCRSFAIHQYDTGLIFL